MAAFLRERGGHWKGTATNLHEQLVSSAKLERLDELSKKLGELADRTPSLFVQRTWTGNNRTLVLSLENGVGGVGGVGDKEDCECGGRGCLICLTQQLPL